MREDSLIKINDKRFDKIMDVWVANINQSVFNLHLDESDYFFETVDFIIHNTRNPDREEAVTQEIKKILRKRRLNAGKTILVGYDTQYLKPPVLEAILNKIRMISAYKDVVFKQITAAKITQSVDKILYEDYYIPDLLFVVIEL
jgi:hypothetical protein